MASRDAAGTLRSADMERVSLEQLKAIKEQSDLEVNLLQDSLNKIRTATTRLEIASTALHDLSLRPQGKKMLVPLTASLYVPGTLDDADKVLVDVGTGYFIEVLDQPSTKSRRTHVPMVPVLGCPEEIEILPSLEMPTHFQGGKKTMAEGKDYCIRKINLLKSNYDELIEVASKKKVVADEAGAILQAKLRQASTAP